MKDCIFCKIVKKEIPADIVYASDRIIAFPDINPVAPVHILVIPTRHIASMNDLSSDDYDLIGEMVAVAVELAKKKKIAENGYKLLIRTGADGGQEVSHIHLHLIGGAPLYEDIHPA